MNRPIRILIHGMTANVGGLETFLMGYYRNVNPEKIQFDFLCVNDKPAYYQEIIKRGSKVYIIPGRRRYITYYRKLTSIFKKNKYDVFWSNRSNLAGTSLLFKIAFKQKVPVRIIHAHSTGSVGHWVYSGLFMHRIEMFWILKLATDFWACSSEAACYYFGKKFLKLATFKLIHNAIDNDKFNFNKQYRDITRESLSLSDKLVIGHIGMFGYAKNHNFVVRIFHEIYKKESNAVLLLVGDGKLRSEIETKVKFLCLKEVVHFLGIRSDIPALLNAMDIFLFPSKFEGLGIALIEAQATSLRCFASTTVPSAAAITNLLSFVDLQKKPEEWANIILSKRNYDRIDMTEEIQRARYDIKTQATELEHFLFKRVEQIR
ncbi:MAG: glycosyltransferase family 1 protein [Chitinispirillales bacterium]|jgi:glycosyltransferase involved in cell wall biosynthesis|nr:glycosyltransferase family 1 protein [Chitinispirillales bacterium]